MIKIIHEKDPRWLYASWLKHKAKIIDRLEMEGKTKDKLHDIP
jgi:hypothetical protein